MLFRKLQQQLKKKQRGLLMYCGMALLLLFHFSFMHGHFFCDGESLDQTTQEAVEEHNVLTCCCCSHFSANLLGADEGEGEIALIPQSTNHHHCNCQPILGSCSELQIAFSFLSSHFFYSMWWGEAYVEDYCLLIGKSLHVVDPPDPDFLLSGAIAYQTLQIRQTIELRC